MTPDWRIKDRIIKSYYDMLNAGTPPNVVWMSTPTRTLLGMEMQMVGEIQYFFGMAVMIDESLVERDYMVSV